MEKTTHLSRRRFVKNGAMAAASVTAFNVLKPKEARAAAPLKVGLLGCGGRGRGAVQDCLKAAEILNAPETKVTALADILPDRIEAAKAVLGQMDNEVDDDQCFIGWESYKELFKTDVDYVILATPPVFRPETLMAAVEAKKNVFMEKPAAVDPPGIRKIIEAGEKAKTLGLSIAAGTQRRHQAPYVETIKRIHDGVIGDIMAGYAYWCGGPIAYGDRKPGMSDVEYQIRSWYHFLWLSGDHIVEQHVHNLDVINWIMGKHPVKAFGTGGRAWQKRGNIWDHHGVVFHYDNDVILTSFCSQTPRPERNDRVNEFVQGSKGKSNCAGWIQSDTTWNFEGDSVNPYVQEHVDLMNSIYKNAGLNEARNVAESTMTAILGRMAEYSGKQMSWDEAIHSEESLAPHKTLAEYEFGPMKLSPIALPGGQPYTGNEGWKPG